MDEIHYMTQEKKDELEAELAELNGVHRKEIITALEYAKSLGDLSENAEYHQTREDQAKLEDRIRTVENLLKTSQIVSKHNNGGLVDVGSTVTVRKEGTKEDRVFEIVGSEESDMSQGRLSNRSPLGEALFGRQKGETIEFETPGGKVKYAVISVA